MKERAHREHELKIRELLRSEKELLFDRWVNSLDITTFEGLCDLIILEDFLNGLPKNVATFVSEHKNI